MWKVVPVIDFKIGKVNSGSSYFAHVCTYSSESYFFANSITDVQRIEVTWWSKKTFCEGVMYKNNPILPGNLL